MVDISIIVPVYNAEKSIRRCIESVLTQTMKNWELLLINDGSIDNSKEICSFYENKDTRIKLINKNNSGVSDTRNLGVDLSEGEYITFLDADDWIEHDMLEIMLSNIKKLDVSILLMPTYRDQKNISVNNFISTRKNIFTKKEIQLEFFKQDLFTYSVWGKLYKKNILKDIRFDKCIQIGEDMLYLWKALNSVDKIGYISFCKYHYDLNMSQTVTSSFKKRWFFPTRLAENFYIEVKDISKEHEILSRLFIIFHLVFLVDLINKTQNINNKHILIYFRKIVRRNLKDIWHCSYKNLISNRLKIKIIYFVILSYLIGCKN